MKDTPKHSSEMRYESKRAKIYGGRKRPRMLGDSIWGTWKQDRDILQHQKRGSTEYMAGDLLYRFTEVGTEYGSIFDLPCKVEETKDRIDPEGHSEMDW
jgi:hypothetical protein